MRVSNSLLSLALVILLAVVLSIPTVSAVQGPGAEMMIDVEMRITGISTIDGSGQATITFAGDAVAPLRVHMATLYDSDGNQYLDIAEAKMFLTSVSQSVVGKIYWGVAIVSATNFSNVPDTQVADGTSGLVNTRLDSTNSLRFSIDFEGSGSSEDRSIEPVQDAYDTFAQSVYDASGYLFNGTMVVDHRTTYLGLGSFTEPNLAGGRLSSLRTPAGTVIWYSYDGPSDSAANDDSLRYQVFSIMENPQISFAVLLVGCYMIFRTPGRQFDKFEKLHPRKFRKFAKPLITVRVLALALIALLSVLYLLPFAFSWASVNAIFYAGYLFLLVPGAVILEYYLGKFMYDRAALKIPDESIVDIKQARIEREEQEGEMLCKICYTPIEAGLDMFRCNCGLTMHMSCAQKSQNCPSCGAVLFAQQTRSIECKSCGETFMYSGSEDAYSIQCTKCGAFQEEIKPGNNYIIVDDDPRNAFMMIRAMARSERPTLCLTSQFPGKIRSDYDLGDVSIKWFSDSSTDIDNLNPKDLEGAPMETISTFLMTTKSAGVLLDGVDMLIQANGFDKVLAFIKRLNDLASIHGSTIILSLDKKSVSEEQYRKISDEFDEIHDFQ